MHAPTVCSTGTTAGAARKNLKYAPCVTRYSTQGNARPTSPSRRSSKRLRRSTAGLIPGPSTSWPLSLGRHMKQHSLTTADVANVTLRGGKAEFINFVSSVLGQGCQATVSYDLRRGNDLSLMVSGMEMAEWSGVLGRIAPALERLNDSRTLGASVSISGDGNEPDQLEHMLRQLPGSHMAGMEATFKPRSKE